VSSYARLAKRIQTELTDLERVQLRALDSWEHAKRAAAEQDVYLESVALNLHGLYSGLEKLFEHIARYVDHFVPTGDMWHRDVLQQMTEVREKVRPAVISQESWQFLDELRRFRHVVRNVYTFNLVPEKMQPLLAGLQDQWPQTRAELLAFADYVTALAKVS
jgi:hypothetical protein